MTPVARQFKGIWIPAHIWLDSNLSIIEKCLFAEVHSWTSNDSTCYKSNATLAEEFMVSVSSIKRAVRKLDQKGYVIVTRTATGRSMKAAHIDLPPAQNEQGVGRSEPSVGSNCTALGSNCTPTSTNTSTGTNTTTSTMKMDFKDAYEVKVQYPWPDTEFVECWEIWLQERRERRYKRYTQRGEQAALHKLQKESNGDLHTAIGMVHQSIANGWQGIFPLRNSNNGSRKGFDASQIDGSKLRTYIESLGGD